MVDAKKVEMKVRVGEWVLVPRDLPSEALSMLANFDMESIGYGAEDGAAECWSRLIDLAACEPRLLEFQKPVFHEGWNTTVRRGRKWSKEYLAKLQLGQSFIVVELRSRNYYFSQLSDHILRDEHDPSCRTVDGLFAEMCRVYPGFCRNEEVTVVDFWLPEVNQEDRHV